MTNSPFPDRRPSLAAGQFTIAAINWHVVATADPHANRVYITAQGGEPLLVVEHCGSTFAALRATDEP
jgi:sulfatase maturation enzyme AslB (radical SAM superfamily)